ncbi:hypothetical protein [Novipirellula artificiosorum]|uniref:Uncharacterized protein n=1 Tax=Novipirellula artificiosorum TaxID=2528016 RepID=A0A5C6DWD4_9BACT|nr:hypothetical protein [Novipirellula artificiosorum]TWU40902.1 hypothetical protein Poly41_17370 [Novipirellula artificiosorum]
MVVVSKAADNPLLIRESQARDSVQWLATMAMRELPPKYEGDKGWGETRKVWAGVHTRLDGFKIKTHRRYREQEHGRWVRYEIMLPPSGSPHAAKTTVHSVTRTQQELWHIESTSEVLMTFNARIQRWNYGVKWYSVTVSGKMRVRLRLGATIGFHADYLEVPPALVIDPRVDTAELKMASFEVERVSHIGGDAAEAWGEVMQELIVERFIEAQNDRIVAKLNHAIDKHRDDLRLSWPKLLGESLP